MTRTFVLGIDGGSWRILDDLDLPAFERLMEGGTAGTLRSTLPPITYPAWKCYSTGKNPGKLGVFGFINFDRERRENRQNDATHFDSAELWDYLSDAGKRVGVVNMPSTYPPHEVNGIMIAGPNSGESGYVEPAERESEVEAMGYKPLSNGHRLGLQSGGDTTTDIAESLFKSRFETTRQLLAEESFDLFNLTIYETDPVQHHCWGGPEITEVYQSLDRELGLLLDQLESDDEMWDVVVVSDHGFRPIRGAVYLDTWLEVEGFLETKEEAKSGPSTLGRFGLTTNNAKRVVQRLGIERLVGRLPDSVTSGLNDRLGSEGGMSVIGAVEWDRSDAVFLMGGIYVLDQDRRESVINELEEALRSFTINGDRVVDEVYRTDEVYSGQYVSAAPDLIPLVDDYKLLGFSGDESLFDPEEAWIGAHEMDGMFVGSGPSFKHESDAELDIYDVAPTILHTMRLPIPSDIDGTVRQDILVDDDSVREREPLHSTGSRGATDADQERMEDNLRQLGYLE